MKFNSGSENNITGMKTVRCELGPSTPTPAELAAQFTVNLAEVVKRIDGNGVFSPQHIGALRTTLEAIAGYVGTPAKRYFKLPEPGQQDALKLCIYIQRLVSEALWLSVFDYPVGGKSADAAELVSIAINAVRVLEEMAQWRMEKDSMGAWERTESVSAKDCGSYSASTISPSEVWSEMSKYQVPGSAVLLVGDIPLHLADETDVYRVSVVSDRLYVTDAKFQTVVPKDIPFTTGALFVRKMENVMAQFYSGLVEEVGKVKAFENIEKFRLYIVC